MRIAIDLNGNKYAIEVDGNCFTAIKFGINQDKDSKNFGKETEIQLGYFSKLYNAALRCAREEIAQSNDIVSLKEFVAIVEANNNQLREQLESVVI